MLVPYAVSIEAPLLSCASVTPHTSEASEASSCCRVLSLFRSFSESVQIDYNNDEDVSIPQYHNTYNIISACTVNTSWNKQILHRPGTILRK